MLSEPTTILLTGGTSGIGLALLRLLNGMGHRLVVIARLPEKLESLQDEFYDVATYACDLSDSAALNRCLAQVLTKHPDISVLINNAAVQNTPKLLDADFDYHGIAQEVELNFSAPVRLAYLCLKHFVAHERKSAIVNISSGLAFYPKTGAAVYCASKAALHSFTQSLRYQIEGTPVSVIEAIIPIVNTPMTAGRGSGKMTASEAAAQIVRGMLHGQNEIYVGKARLIPLLSRAAPSILRNILKRSG